MSLNVIPNDIPTLTQGERSLLNKIKKLYEDVDNECYLYIQPKLKNLEPDFILIDSLKGVCLIEVKDWSIGYLSDVNRINVTTTDGKTLKNPIFKTNQYFNLAKGIFESEDILYNEDGFLKINIYSKTVFINISSEEIRENNLERLFNQPPTKYITSNDIRNLSIDNLFSIESCNIDKEDLLAIRSILFPEIKISQIVDKKKSNNSSIKALDADQERFAKRLPYGHYMVSGVPGSGKTVILLSRALHLIRQNPEWKIRIVTYNKSLASKIEKRIDEFADEYKFMGINIENISVSTFHKLALEVAHIGVPQKKDDEWWKETLPKEALEKAKPRFDAILIDEYQDFYDSWIELSVKVCKTHKYTNNKNETVEGKNLFLAGDRLQSIYNPKEQSWKSLGIDMRGRSVLLKRAYRTGKSHINLALDFLMKEDLLKKEVENFYEGRNDIENENVTDNEVIFLEGNYKVINNLLMELVYKVGYKPQDILILCREWRECNKLFRSLENSLKNKAKVTKEPVESLITITTYYSSKGLEAPVCILTDVSKFKSTTLKSKDLIQRKLLYVGMTRASERLYIHAGDYEEDSFAKQLKFIK